MLERLKGKAKELAGSLLGDRDLERQGELHVQTADARDAAEQHEARADQRRAEADVTAREREVRAERERLEAEVTAEQRDARIDAQRARAEQQAEVQQGREQTVAAHDRLVRETAISADEQRAARDHDEEARAARDAERKADVARRVAEALGDTAPDV